MAEIKIAGTLHNTEAIQGDDLHSHVVANANEILDTQKGKKQSDINADVDAALDDRYTKEETYNKSELNNMITTPDVEYITVQTYVELLAITDHPEGAIYRVANWDGTQVVTNKYTEYSYNGTGYVILAVRDHGIANASDFENPTEAQRDLLPTVGAYLDAMDATPTAGSVKPVQSGGVHKGNIDIMKKMSREITDISLYNYSINADGTFGSNSSYKHGGISVTEGQEYIIENYGTSNNIRYAFVTSIDVTSGGSIPLVNGTSVGVVSGNSSEKVTIPSGCSYLIFNHGTYSSNLYAYNLEFDTGENLHEVGIYSYLDNTDTGLITKEGVKAYTNSMLDWLFVNKLISLTASNIVAGKYLKNDNTVSDASDAFRIRTYDVKESCCYVINGYSGAASGAVFYLWLDENNNVISYNDTLPRQKSMRRELTKAPAGAVKLRVQGHNIYQTAACSEITARQNVLAIYAPYLTVSFTSDSITVSIGTLYVVWANGITSTYTNLSLTTSGVSATIKWNPTDGLFATNNSTISDNDTLVLLRVTGRKVIGGLLYSEYVKVKEENDITNLINLIPDSAKNNIDYVQLNNRVINVDGSIGTTSSPRVVRKYSIQASGRYVFYGHVNSDDQTWYALYSGETVVVAGEVGTGSGKFYTKVLNIPDGVDTVYIGSHQNYPPQLFTLKDVDGGAGSKTIYPLLTHDILRTSNGEFSTNSAFADGTRKCTPRFIKVSGRQCNVATSIAGTLYVFEYNSNFEFINFQSNEVEANIGVDVTLQDNTSYIKLYQSTETTAIPIIKLIGVFPDNWDTFNIRPVNVKSGSSSSAVFAPGFRRISVLVNVTHPNCCDDEGSVVQDSQELLPDYGMIALPETYSNTGVPTRLIIYCHGAAVNYADSVTGFNAQDLEPDYWLAEGYAVMDIEGNPFDNVNEHCQIPQAMDSYVAAYKWAIEHFNLKRDGVFLGGRSMGGGTAFTLMRRDCSIPVIASCPNSAAAGPYFGNSHADRKTFFAEHCGFILPEGFTFGSGLIAAEKSVFLINWDRWIKATPIFNFITDLPVGDTEKQNYMDMIWDNDADEIKSWYESRHAIAKCPVKLFGCNQDTTCPPDTTSKRYYRMLLNGGQITECRIFNSYKDYSGTGTSAHHYDTQDPALRATVTTRFGVEMTNVPVVYIEMLQFWRRYEQGN